MTLSRRGVLAAAFALPFAAPALAASETLQVTPERKASLSVWAPAAPKGVVLFSHGHGSWPDRYERTMQTLTGAGLAVLAPLHVDSTRHPDRARFSMEAGFMERLRDMKAVSAEAADRYPGLPVAAVGHSFGSLISFCLGGALAYIAPLRDPTVKAVLAFSSPGKIPGLIAPPAYASLAVPAMMITGDADTVPGFVSDWREHLFPIETAPAGGKYAVTFEGAAHNLGGEPSQPAYEASQRYAAAFLKAELFGDIEARKLIDTAAGPGETWLRR